MKNEWEDLRREMSANFFEALSEAVVRGDEIDAVALANESIFRLARPEPRKRKPRTRQAKRRKRSDG